jgi:hypothetical protein
VPVLTPAVPMHQLEGIQMAVIITPTERSSVILFLVCSLRYVNEFLQYKKCICRFYDRCGCLFVQVWGAWWLVALCDTYLTALALNRPFSSRPWYHAFFGPTWLRRIPLEPVLKVILPSIGILGELWLGHESWRRLIAPDGKFVVDNINDWQHSAMYLAFVISGVMDLIGFYSKLPTSVEHGFLSLAFLTQGILLVFHLKGPSIEVMVHLILVLQIFATFVAMLAEGSNRKSIVVAMLRPLLTILQGVWWIQTAFIMFTADPAYDPDYMGGTMMVPAVFVMHMLWLAAASVAVLLLMKRMYSSMFGREIQFVSQKSDYRQLDSLQADVELASVQQSPLSMMSK